MIIKKIKNSVQQKNESLFSGKYNRLILLAFLIAFFNQLSGINAIIYFAPGVFEMAGLAGKDSLFHSSCYRWCQFYFHIGRLVFDRSGWEEERLLFIGSIGYIVIALVGWHFHFRGSMEALRGLYSSLLQHMQSGKVPLSGFLFQKFFQTRFVQPECRSVVCTHWVFAALISQTFFIFCAQKGIFRGSPCIFGFFAVMMVFQLLFVWK